MLERLFVDNYKCLVNFELRLEEMSLLLGPDGPGSPRFSIPSSPAFVDFLANLTVCAGQPRVDIAVHRAVEGNYPWWARFNTPGRRSAGKPGICSEMEGIAPRRGPARYSLSCRRPSALRASSSVESSCTAFCNAATASSRRPCSA